MNQLSSAYAPLQSPIAYYPAVSGYSGAGYALTQSQSSTQMYPGGTPSYGNYISSVQQEVLQTVVSIVADLIGRILSGVLNRFPMLNAGTDFGVGRQPVRCGTPSPITFGASTDAQSSGQTRSSSGGVFSQISDAWSSLKDIGNGISEGWSAVKDIFSNDGFFGKAIAWGKNLFSNIF